MRPTMGSLGPAKLRLRTRAPWSTATSIARAILSDELVLDPACLGSG